jgi:hypothetical protein
VQQINGGFTDLFVVTLADATETTDDTDQAIKLLDLAVGDIVYPNVLMEVKSNAAGLTTANASVGINDALTAFVAASSLLAAGNEYFVPAESAPPYATVATGKSLVINLDPGADTAALSDLTALEVWVWVQISRKSDRAIEA